MKALRCLSRRQAKVSVREWLCGLVFMLTAFAAYMDWMKKTRAGKCQRIGEGEIKGILHAFLQYICFFFFQIRWTFGSNNSDLHI